MYNVCCISVLSTSTLSPGRIAEFYFTVNNPTGRSRRATQNYNILLVQPYQEVFVHLALLYDEMYEFLVSAVVCGVTPVGQQPL